MSSQDFPRVSNFGPVPTRSYFVNLSSSGPGIRVQEYYKLFTEVWRKLQLQVLGVSAMSESNQSKTGLVTLARLVF